MLLKYFAVALAGALSLLLVPQTALADCSFGTLTAGAEACTSAVYALTFARAEGSTNASDGLRFRVFWSASGQPLSYVAIYDMTAQGFAAEYVDSGPTEAYIPGYFSTCAKRKVGATSSASYDICTSGN